MKFNIDDYPIGSGVVMHCPAENEANRFLEHLDSIGIRWSSGRPLVPDTRWNSYGRDTAYLFTADNKGRRCVEYSESQWYKDNGFVVLQSHDFDFDSEEDDLLRGEEIVDYLNSLITK